MFTKQINASMTSGVLHALPLYRDDEPAIDVRTAAPGCRARFSPSEDCRCIAMAIMTGTLMVKNTEHVNFRSAISCAPVTSEPLEYPLACV
ncbi:hypothetical protein [Burkholderia sp. RS02]|uniref:hypothetical protein n=1 Tax=unclassified Burkholderia TaxID=2613784 RepID=UPI003218956F